MQITLQILLFIVGFILIVYGGDSFVDAALAIGRKIGISPLILGATIVSLTTTLPELFVSTIASASGHTDLAIGNAVGSIICNTGLVLGLCAILSPMILVGQSQIKKGILLLVSIVVLFLLTILGPVTLSGGLCLYALLIVYLWINFKEMKYAPDATDDKTQFSIKHVFMFVIGACSIILGSNILVNSASKLAELLCVPEKLIALSVVALGTSLPELVTSLTAIKKKEAGLSIGNIIGANILNIVLVMATSSIFADGGLTTSITQSGILKGKNQLLILDIPIAFLLACCLLYCVKNKRVSRLTGILLLFIYVGYLGFMSYAVL